MITLFPAATFLNFRFLLINAYGGQILNFESILYLSISFIV